MFEIPFTKKARERKEKKLALSAARIYYYSNADIMDAQKASELKEAIEKEDVQSVNLLLSDLDKPKSFSGLREWLDIFVVSISVAMAFRAYFYEPFNIPTGSMQPTLYGVHSVAGKPEDATVWDSQPFRFFKYIIMGSKFQEYRAPSNGKLILESTNEGVYRMFVNTTPSQVMEVPTDVLDAPNGRVELPGTIKDYWTGLRSGSNLIVGPSVRKGDLLWCGTVYSGDFLFVNRFLWNFRKPRRGDVMIFATTGINKIQQGTHYIKRMVGLPGETISMQAPKLFVNGVDAATLYDYSGMIKLISSQGKISPDAPKYAGFRPCGHDRDLSNGYVYGKELAEGAKEVKLGEDEYFACGDNSFNSYDSRYWGNVPGDKLRGIAAGVFWPFGSPRWGRIK